MTRSEQQKTQTRRMAATSDRALAGLHGRSEQRPRTYTHRDPTGDGPERRERRYSGQQCLIVRELGDAERDREVGRMFRVRFADGGFIDAFRDELS